MGSDPEYQFDMKNLKIMALTVAVLCSVVLSGSEAEPSIDTSKVADSKQMERKSDAQVMQDYSQKLKYHVVSMATNGMLFQGVIIDAKKGLVLSCAHQFNTATEGKNVTKSAVVVFANKKTTLANLISVDLDSDLSLYKIDNLGFFAEIRTSI